MGRVAEMVDPHCAHITRGRQTSSSHHLGRKHAPPLTTASWLCWCDCF